MFQFCSLTNTGCQFCGKSRYNPKTGDYDNITRTFCGSASGYDTTINALEKCWLKMTKSEKSKHTKRQGEEFKLISAKRRKW